MKHLQAPPMRRLLSATLIFSLIGLSVLSFPATAYGADASGFSNFTPKHPYKSGHFFDVPGGAWFYDSVKKAYELGLMTGKSPPNFDPSGSVTLAEAISMAAKTHSIYSGEKGILPKAAPAVSGPAINTSGAAVTAPAITVSGPAINTSGAAVTAPKHWYDDAVDYALKHGIMKKGDFSRLEAPASRGELAYLFSGACSADGLPPINAVVSLPDVTDETPYQENILTLYRAGVTSGSDSSGTFHPDLSITRGEAASVICRIALPEERRSFQPEDLKDSVDSTTKPAIFVEQQKGFTLSAPADWREPLSYYGTASRLSLLRKVPAPAGAKGQITAAEILSYVSLQKDAAAPLQIFHRLTAESLTKELKGRILSAPTTLSLADGDITGQLSVLSASDKENALYWVLTAENRDSFITLIARAAKDSDTEIQNELLRIIKSLTLVEIAPPVSKTL